MIQWDEPNFSPYDGLRQFPHRARWKSMEGPYAWVHANIPRFSWGMLLRSLQTLSETWNLMESHGISWNLHLKGMGARELGSKVIAKTIDAESYSVYIYIFIYLYIYSIYLFIYFKKILYNYTILQVIPHASGYRLELPTLSVCWVPLARPSFHRSVHMRPLRTVHYSVLQPENVVLGNPQHPERIHQILRPPGCAKHAGRSGTSQGDRPLNQPHHLRSSSWRCRVHSGEQILRSGPMIKPSVARYFNEEYLGNNVEIQYPKKTGTQR